MPLLSRSVERCQWLHRRLLSATLLLLFATIAIAATATPCQLCGCPSCPADQFPLGNPDAELTFSPEELNPNLLDAIQHVESLGFVINCAFIEQALQQEQDVAAVAATNHSSSCNDALRLSPRIRTLCECPPLPEAIDGASTDDPTEATPRTVQHKRASWDFILTLSLFGLAAVLFLAGTVSRWKHWRRREQSMVHTSDAPQPPVVAQCPPTLVPQSVVDDSTPKGPDYEHQQSPYTSQETRDLEEAIYQSTLEAVLRQSRDTTVTLLDADQEDKLSQSHP